MAFAGLQLRPASVAADIVDACIEAGIRIPDQVAVLGVDNDPVICDCVQVPLASVRHDLEGMAFEAALLEEAVRREEIAAQERTLLLSQRSHAEWPHTALLYGASVEVRPWARPVPGRGENFADAVIGVIQFFREVLAKNGWYWGTTLVLLHSGHRAVFFSCSLIDIVRVKLLSHFLQRYS